jgi:hypothetical protein
MTYKHFLPLTLFLFLIVFLTACSPSPAAWSGPQLLPSPAADWMMTLTQTGGFAGVMLKVVVSSDGRLTAVDQRSGRTVTQTVPANAIPKLSALVHRLAAITPGAQHSGCADCFNYELQIDSGGRSVQIHADDTTLGDSGAQDIIRLLQSLRDAALRG